MPMLIRQFSKIKDYRRAKSIQHKITVLMMYGLLIFVFKLPSRREANKTLSRACLSEKLREIFPEYETIPHADTLARLLEKVDPLELEKININLAIDLIKNKKSCQR